MSRTASIVQTFEKAQSRLVLQASDLSLLSVADMVKSNAIDVRPEFQRRERWSVRQSSALIESFLLNIPVPPVYLAEEEFGRYAVIDGKQRITAVHSFIHQGMRLTGLGKFPEIESFSFDQLPPELQNALSVRPYIRVVTLLRQSNPLTKYEVFHRLNSGGEPLNAQEIRNVVFRGKLNDLIMKLSANEFLRTQLKIRDNRSNAYRTMQDVEYVLRFLTLEDSWRRFGGDFRESMDAYMGRHANPSEAFIRKKRDSFNRSIAACELIFDEHAFQRHERGQWRNQTLGALYDAQMISFASLSDAEINKIASKKRQVVESYKALFSDPDFDSAIRQGTNNPAKLRYRIGRSTEALAEHL